MDSRRALVVTEKFSLIRIEIMIQSPNGNLSIISILTEENFPDSRSLSDRGGGQKGLRACSLEHRTAIPVTV